jgi:hypothetical protein
MILESRKWRLVLRILALVLTTGMMLAVAGPVSYALQDDTPKQISVPRQLYGPEGEPLTDTYVYLEAVPELDRSVRTGEGDDTRYWLPLKGYAGVLFLRTDEGKYLLPYRYTGEPGSPLYSTGHFSGKLTTLKGQPDAEKAVDALAAQGIYVDVDTAMVLLQGEEPKAYRPIVPIMPLLALFWVVVLVGAWQIWRGRQRPRRAARIF